MMVVIGREALRGDADAAAGDRGQGDPDRAHAVGLRRRGDGGQPLRRHRRGGPGRGRAEGSGETSVETSSLTFDYVPGHAERKGGLFFTEDPRRHRSRSARSATRRPDANGGTMALDPETFDALIDTIRRFVAERLRPLEEKVAESDEVPDEIVARDAGDGAVRPLHSRGIWRARPHHVARKSGSRSNSAAPRRPSARSSAPMSASAARAWSWPAATSRKANGCRGSPAARSSPASR